MRDGNERLLDILEAIEEIERYAVRGREAFCRMSWCRSGWFTIFRSSGKQPHAFLWTCEALLPAFLGNR